MQTGVFVTVYGVLLLGYDGGQVARKTERKIDPKGVSSSSIDPISTP
jgi:hypothetical protein